jgi:outer membrane lipoprotein SlyB
MHGPDLKPALALCILTLPLTTCQTDTGAGFVTGAAGGAVIGAVVGGPVGAAVGGIAGATAGGVLTSEEAKRVRTYVATQQRPSLGVSE